jgi:hypothetical protein
MAEQTSLKNTKVENPTTTYDEPHDIVKDKELSHHEKKKVLNTWEQDARQLMTASNEGMPGSKEGLESEDNHRFSAEQYRAKAAEFRALLTNIRRSPNETSEFRNLEQTYTTLAENEEWMAINIDKTIRQREDLDNRTSTAEEEEHILRWVGTGAIA